MTKAKGEPAPEKREASEEKEKIVGLMGRLTYVQKQVLKAQEILEQSYVSNIDIPADFETLIKGARMYLERILYLINKR
jgi:hypothetical protein